MSVKEKNASVLNSHLGNYHFLCGKTVQDSDGWLGCRACAESDIIAPTVPNKSFYRKYIYIYVYAQTLP